jgi:hypothetical protein
MTSPQDVGKLIIKVLHEKSKPVEADYMAYLTGSTITNVLDEGYKLKELGLIEIEGSTFNLTKKNTKFSGWDRLKKK